MTKQDRVLVTYVFDAYCGWCFGFERAFEQFIAAHQDRIDLEVVSGGLFLGPRVVPIGTMPYIVDANARISALTGAEFGAAYQRLVAEGTFAMDSLDAAVGFAALQGLAPDRGVEIVATLQRAFYTDGLSLSDPATYRVVADRLGLAPDEVVAAAASPAVRRAAQEGFRRARALGVESFPTVLVTLPDGRTGRLGGPVSTAAQLAQSFDLLLTEVSTVPTTAR